MAETVGAGAEPRAVRDGASARESESSDDGGVGAGLVAVVGDSIVVATAEDMPVDNSGIVGVVDTVGAAAAVDGAVGVGAGSESVDCSGESGVFDTSRERQTRGSGSRQQKHWSSDTCAHREE